MIWLALTICLLTVLYTQIWNTKRARSTTVELTPNCLLTRYPLLFLSGKNSLFYHGNYWNSLPDHLAQHGYEVFNCELKPRNRKKRTDEIRQIFESLDKQNNKLHVFIDSTSIQEMKTILANSLFHSIASITYVHDNSLTDDKSTGLFPIKSAIEEITILPRGTKNLAWRLHCFLVSDADRSPAAIGCANSKDLEFIKEQFLRRAIDLAERDYSQIGKHHEQHQERTL